MDFCGLNKSYAKDNFPTPFIYQILDDCARSDFFLLWMNFHSITKFRLSLRTNIRWNLFVLGVHLHALKNVVETFQWDMTFAFHNLKHMVKSCLDDLAAHSQKRVDHPAQLPIVFERCHHYYIRLNPHKCVFCVSSGQFLVFLVSNTGIMVDPLKF
jgi:hypothetical protein